MTPYVHNTDDNASSVFNELHTASSLSSFPVAKRNYLRPNQNNAHRRSRSCLTPKRSLPTNRGYRTALHTLVRSFSKAHLHAGNAKVCTKLVYVRGFRVPLPYESGMTSRIAVYMLVKTTSSAHVYTEQVM